LPEAGANKAFERVLYPLEVFGYREVSTMKTGRSKSAKVASGDVEAKTKPHRAVSPEQRHRNIEESAYYRAERRAFQGGDPVQDWLAAEKEIDKTLEAPARQRETQEMAAYERMRQELAKILGGVRDTVNVETIRQAFDRAAKELKDAGGYTTETVNRVTERLRREVASTSGKLGPRWEEFSDKTAGLFTVWLERSSTFVSQASGAVGEWLKQLQSKNGREVHIAGQIVEPGSFECTACRHQVKVVEKGALSPCPSCQKREFRRL
jgi:hypothetical protein